MWLLQITETIPLTLSHTAQIAKLNSLIISQRQYSLNWECSISNLNVSFPEGGGGGERRQGEKKKKEGGGWRREKMQVKKEWQ